MSESPPNDCTYITKQDRPCGHKPAITYWHGPRPQDWVYACRRHDIVIHAALTRSYALSQWTRTELTE